jgi:tetrahydromethanopterin S-methyltransferase subunit F
MLIALEFFFLGLLGLATIAIGFVSAVVLVHLYRGQR